MYIHLTITYAIAIVHFKFAYTQCGFKFSTEGNTVVSRYVIGYL